MIAFVAFTQVGFAQKDPVAGKILDDMSKKYQTMKVFNAVFTQTLENPNNKIKESVQGDITVSGNKFRLKMKDQEIINNGSTIWTYMKSENEVNISDNDPTEEQMSPLAIFSMYKKGYKYALVETVKEAGQTYNVIELSPEDRNNQLSKIRLQINKKDNTVKSWKMFRDNGNRYTYVIKQFTPELNVDANYFGFDKAKYKGVKVIDLR